MLYEVITGYVGSLLMAGGFLAIGSCISALTKNQVIAFVISVMACLIFSLTAWPFVMNVINAVLPGVFADAVASLSFLTHFDAITRGVIDLLV